VSKARKVQGLSSLEIKSKRERIDNLLPMLPFSFLPLTTANDRHRSTYPQPCSPYQPAPPPDASSHLHPSAVPPPLSFFDLSTPTNPPKRPKTLGPFPPPTQPRTNPPTPTHPSTSLPSTDRTRISRRRGSG
jgi:hypothetical protein